MSPARTSSTPRWGHAVGVMSGLYRTLANAEGQRDLVDKMMLFGGDDYNEDSGGGGYHSFLVFPVSLSCTRNRDEYLERGCSGVLFYLVRLFFFVDSPREI